LIQNAISNRRNEIKLLKPSLGNIGGQTLLNEHFNKSFEKNISNHYLVEVKMKLKNFFQNV
jgi:hypothetical protein